MPPFNETLTNTIFNLIERFIKFDGGDEETDLEEVELRHVQSVKILTSGTDSMGKTHS